MWYILIMARYKNKFPTKARTWQITQPALESMEELRKRTGMSNGQLASFAIIALHNGFTRSDYVSALLQAGEITLKEAKEGWGL